MRRHMWSVSLGVLSTLLFVSLASEIHDGELQPFDKAAATWVTSRRGHWDGPMLFITRSGGFPWMAAVCVLAVVALAAGKLRKEARFVAICGLGAMLISTSLKLLFQRARPDVTDSYLLGLPASFSFPSGHAMGSACVVASLVIVGCVKLSRRFRWPIITAGLVYVLAVGASRVYFGAHYASDVLGGQLASAAWVAAVTGWFYPRLLPGESSTGTPPPQ